MAMIDANYERIMQDELDGVASEQDLARLHAWLAQSAEGRARFAELGSLFQALKGVGLADPPPGIREAVARGIEADRRREVKEHQGWLEALRASLSRRPALRLAFPAAAGALAAVIALAWIMSPGVRQVPGQDVTGTMAPAHDGEPSFDRQSLELPGAAATVSTRPDQDGLEVDIEAHSASPVGLMIDFDERIYHDATFHQVGGPTAQAELLAGRLVVRGSGNLKFQLHLTESGEAGSPLAATLRSEAGSIMRSVRTGGTHR
jgi:hypothetical protein